MALDRTLPGIQGLRHVVVLMMENRSFDHMLGAHGVFREDVWMPQIL